MTTYTRLMAVAVAFSAGLFQVGCTTTVSKALPRQPVVDFAVVKSSTPKELTPAQLAALRATVLAYLQEHGLADNRTYYVEVRFPAANPAEDPQWVIVRVNNRTTPPFTVIAAYPGSEDNYPFEYYGSSYFSRSYPGFTRYDYYDPYFADHGKYAPPASPPEQVRPHQPDHKRDHPPGTHTRWDRHPRRDGDQPRAPPVPPLSPDDGRKKRDHDPAHGRPRDDYRPRPASGPAHDYTPPAPRPEPSPAYSAPARDNARSEPVQNQDDRRDPPQNER